MKHGWFSTIICEIHYHLRRCSFCHWRMATWWLAAGLEVACDECVPRGADHDAGDGLDEKGRKWPGYAWRRFVDSEGGSK